MRIKVTLRGKCIGFIKREFDEAMQGTIKVWVPYHHRDGEPECFSTSKRGAIVILRAYEREFYG